MLLLCLGSPELCPEEERNLGAYASILWEPEMQCSKNEWLTYRHFFWCIFFVCTKAHHIFGSLVLFWNGILCHSVESSKVRILIVICAPIRLNAQINFLVCISYNYSYNYCSHWHACVACINWLAILLGSEAEQSSGWANLLGILSVSCTGFAVLTELCVVNATQLLKENQIAIIYLLEHFCYSLHRYWMEFRITDHSSCQIVICV